MIQIYRLCTMHTTQTLRHKGFITTMKPAVLQQIIVKLEGDMYKDRDEQKMVAIKTTEIKRVRSLLYRWAAY